MLKKRLHLRHFLTRFVSFYTATAFETFCKLFFKLLDGCFHIFLLLNRLFLNVYKKHKFDNFKTDKNLFFNEVAFYFI